MSSFVTYWGEFHFLHSFIGYKVSSRTRVKIRLKRMPFDLHWDNRWHCCFFYRWGVPSKNSIVISPSVTQACVMSSLAFKTTSTSTVASSVATYSAVEAQPFRNKKSLSFFFCILNLATIGPVFTFTEYAFLLFWRKSSITFLGIQLSFVIRIILSVCH